MTCTRFPEVTGEIPERTRTVSFLISTQPGVQWTQWKGRQNACEL